MASGEQMVRPESAGDREALRRLFEDTRRRLVETGTRNRLVHVNRANTRGNVLNIVNERFKSFRGAQPPPEAPLDERGDVWGR